MDTTIRQTSLESINYDYDTNPYIKYSEENTECENKINYSREYRFIQRKKLDTFTKLCFKSIVIFIIILFNIPICVTELYYAFTDNSCVHVTSKELIINLYTYLLVDGIYGLIITIICSTYICFFIDIDNLELDGVKKIIINTISAILILFNLSWTFIGAIVFWNLIDDYNCNKNIYSFVFAELVIKIIFQFIQIIRLTNKN
jgi:hypothetical protein